MTRVLIVEDNDKNLKLVRDALRGNGYDTLEARTAEAGLELARTHAPQLILMDIRLPGMSGIEALSVLRADPATARIRVLAVTASVMSGDMGRIRQAGFDGCIAKPIRYESFLAAVRAALGEVAA